ncbi:hypothetical protein PALB_13600 [Pseudoalteromonas luteoviolacea B = ATCC 29581]|nr:hypothetical protein PALB_13600 [Pseudoalteromonas luteoviolacea B = ATCC 29581]
MSSLQDKLQEYKRTFDLNTPPEILETLNRSLSLLQSQRDLSACLTVGSTFPDFTLFGLDGTLYESNRLLLRNPLVVTIIRGSWCPYCVLELRAWQECYERSGNRLNIIAITPELPQFARDMQVANHLSFPIVFDEGLRFTKTLGLHWELDSELQQQLLKWNIDLNERNCCGNAFNLPVPATLLIDTQSVIRYRFVEENYSMRAEPSEVFNAYQLLKG